METTGHIDVLEQRDSLKSPLVASVALHAALFASIFAYASYTGRARELWGDTNGHGGGGAVGVDVVKKIPLPSRGPAVENRVANDTESTVPAAPKPEQKQRVRQEPPPDAIPLKSSKQAKLAPKPTYTSRPSYSRPEGYRSNQLYSQSGAALSSNMYGQISSSGGIGFGPGSAFGNRFGWYQTALTQAIAAKWRPEQAGGTRPGQTVIVTFEIARPNQARNVRVYQGSGNRNLDYAAQRAIMEAAIPPLPPQFERDSAEVEIWFQVKR